MKAAAAYRNLLKCLGMLSLLWCGNSTAQNKIISNSRAEINTMSLGRSTVLKDTSRLKVNICKTYFTIPVNVFEQEQTESQSSKFKYSAISVHGTIEYDFLYRSFADTPFYQKNFQQHTLQGSLTVMVNNYPFHVNIILRKSNSPFFRDFIDGGVSLDRFSYKNTMKQEIEKRVFNQIPSQNYLKELKKLLGKEMDKYDKLKINSNSKDIAQKIIEEREKFFYQSRSSSTVVSSENKNSPTDSVLNSSNDLKDKIKLFKVDSITQSLSQYAEERQTQLDSIQKRINSLQKKVDSVSNQVNHDVSGIRQKIANANNTKELSQVLAEYGIAEHRSRGEKFAADLRAIGVGRTILNYSELTAWNISLTGLNLEYNPGTYAAIAAGKIDYGFRDFLGKNFNQKKQELVLGRFGFGDRDKKAIIFSAFTGRKNNYEHVLADTFPSYVNVAGYSVEGIYKKDEHTYLSAEVAKTTRPVTERFKSNHELQNLYNFSDNRNLGISVKGETVLSETDTKLSATFKRTGEYFQSFNLFSYNTNQTSWLIKVDQPILKNRLSATAMLRRNDFVNPFVQQTFKTTTIFKTFLLNVRIPKWPVVSFGYYPGTQLYILDKIRARENAYYILNGSIVHSYSSGETRLISTFIYNQYSSKATDSGFISYKGTNYSAAQTLIVKKFQLQGHFDYTNQERMQYYTTGCDADYSLSSLFQVGVGGKYNKVISGKIYWGSEINLQCGIEKIGTISLQYEKSYLPTIQQTLFPIEMGRISWFKSF